MSVVTGIGFMALQILVVVAMLVIATRRDRRNQEAIARQVAITDAIHREVGALVAPTVEPGPRGAWRLTIPVPFERPDVVASVVDIAYQTTRTLDAEARNARRPRTPARVTHIVLTPQEDARVCA